MENGSEQFVEQKTKTKKRNVGTVTRDPETVALTRIFTLLNELAAPERGRVVRHIAEKYESDLGGE